MLISVGGLHQGRTTARSRERPEQLGFREEEVRFVAPIDVTAVITRMGYDVYVDCSITTAVVLECSRCLKEFRREMKIGWKMLFVPARPGEKGSSGEAGVFLYRDFIDLADRICEAIRQDLPMKPLCRDDCRGLCPHCGKDLNEGGCNCREKDESYHPFKDMSL